MSQIKTKSLKGIEEMMEGMDDRSIRYQILNNAKLFKTSWIDLGQALYAVYKDKLYKEWGYSTFEAYTAKEIGIKKPTALKLLRSYYFLEKEDPLFLKKDYNERADAATIPTYESVDVLRLARGKSEVDKEDYDQIRRKVLESGKDAREVKKDLTQLIKRREELMPEEAWEKKRLAQLKRIISLLRSASIEIKTSKSLPAKIVIDIDKLISKLQAEL